MRDDQFVEEIRNRFNAGEKLEYVFFWSHQSSKSEITASCFSQWYAASFDVDGERYPTAEHYMMAEKASLFEDYAIRTQVLRAPSPGAAKALGRKVRNFDEEIWVKNRYTIVCRANEAKFSQNHDRYADSCRGESC
jgi:ribA/ribD-fused uncharacterized protein